MKVDIIYNEDCLEGMERLLDKSIDLIYIDPPFNSGKDYKLYNDKWNKMEDYIEWMRPRVEELYRTLKSTGSFYLHCDWHANAYLRIMMDDIFGKSNFRNEVIWSYKRYTAASNRFQRLHDTLLFYSKTNSYTFNEIRESYGTKSGKADSHYKQDENGRWFRWQKRKEREPYRVYLSEGRRLGDVWEMPIINASAKERLGYPTQKPEALLERIVKASSNKGDIVLDAFCGCGTTLVVAQKLRRTWIGFDTNFEACEIAKKRLENIQLELIK